MPRKRPRRLSDKTLALTLLALVVAIIFSQRHASDVDRALVALTGFALVVAFIASTPSTSDNRVADAQLRTEQHLARIAVLLEQQQNVSTVATAATPAPMKRRSSSRIIALILLALVVARVGRWGGNRG